MIKKLHTKLSISLFIFILAFSASANTAEFDVFAFNNSTTGGVGLSTGLIYGIGDSIIGSADPTDIWNAGSLPRWANADGLSQDLFATGSDESGQAVGTLIGTVFPLHNQNSLSLPFGSLVGSIGGDFFLLGTEFNVAAPNSGELLLHYWDSDTAGNTDFVTVSITTIPIPAGMWLFGSALIGLIGFRRKQTV